MAKNTTLTRSPLTVAGPCGIFTHFPTATGKRQFVA